MLSPTQATWVGVRALAATGQDSASSPSDAIRAARAEELLRRTEVGGLEKGAIPPTIGKGAPGVKSARDRAPRGEPAVEGLARHSQHRRDEQPGQQARERQRPAEERRLVGEHADRAD